MTDEDYVRAAVELADGIFSSDSSVKGLSVGLSPVEQSVLDSLAAQLVRQVDALGDVPVMVQSSCYETSILEPDRLTSSDGPDRTMNTIKAIVDSKVLE